MTPELVFTICTVGVLPAWLMLVVAPHWTWTERLVQRAYVPGAVALFYVWALASDPAPPPDGAGFHSLEAVTRLLSTKHSVLAAWLHFVVLDLLAGCWIVRDARRLGISRWWSTPPVVLTFALAPMGVLSWLVLRGALAREDRLQ